MKLINYFQKSKKKLKPLIVAEISGIIVEKKYFFTIHKNCCKSGADLIKIQTYEPQDITINNKYSKKLKKSICGKSIKKLRRPIHGIRGI